MIGLGWSPNPYAVMLWWGNQVLFNSPEKVMSNICLRTFSGSGPSLLTILSLKDWELVELEVRSKFEF